MLKNKMHKPRNRTPLQVYTSQSNRHDQLCKKKKVLHLQALSLNIYSVSSSQKILLQSYYKNVLEANYISPR